MKTDDEVLLYVREIVKKYRDMSYVDSRTLDKELVEYAKPLDIEYTLSHEARSDFKQDLTRYHSTKYGPLADALIECIHMHPSIEGAFFTGSHASPYQARLNSTVVQLIGDMTSLIGILEEHPEWELQL
ncbi:MAG: hypothetical protein KA998_03085 [Rickettsiaceae bacterium]|nr:hypothetical protein [Rickettsiaceae bacterium]